MVNAARQTRGEIKSIPETTHRHTRVGANPRLQKTVSFAEGEVIMEQAQSSEKVGTEMRTCAQRHKEQEHDECAGSRSRPDIHVRSRTRVAQATALSQTESNTHHE